LIPLPQDIFNQIRCLCVILIQIPGFVYLGNKDILALGIDKQPADIGKGGSGKGFLNFYRVQIDFIPVMGRVQRRNIGIPETIVGEKGDGIIEVTADFVIIKLQGIFHIQGNVECHLTEKGGRTQEKDEQGKSGKQKEAP
jgi:hypothetical protein